MFGKKDKGEKLPKPSIIPDLVIKHLVSEKKMDADIAKILKAVVRRSNKGDRTFDIRIFDEAETVVKKIKVNDYNSLTENPALIIYEGWYDEGKKQVELEEKKKFVWDIPLLTEAEIMKKIEELNLPGNTVFFYQARGPATGGPLGRGAAVIELNPNYPGGKQKKYIIYTADVDGMETVGKGQKLFDSDKAKDVARWVKEAHQKRLY